MNRKPTTITNAFSVDLEDWAQGALHPGLPITSRVLKNTDRILTLLDKHNARATFFALGKVCERFPQLLPAIASAGHEVATHGYGHQPVHSMTPASFQNDLRLSIDIITSQIGRRPIGYRAPAFSITNSSLWAGPIMSELGIKYDSSIFPINGRRYGIPNAPRFPHRWTTCDLVEFPLTTIRRFKRNLPTCGGGYTRLLPEFLMSDAIQEINRLKQPAVVYMHPYELDVNELAVLRRNGWPITWRKYIMQSLSRGRVAARLNLLLSKFKFAPLANVLNLNTEPAIIKITRDARSLPTIEINTRKNSDTPAPAGRMQKS